MGVSMSRDRRRQVLEIAREHDLLIIEDDPYGEFWFDEGIGSIPPIRSLPGAEERVVYLGTFSKILAPGFRLAYAIAPPEMVDLLLRAKRGIDFHTDGLLQQTVVRLIRDADFDLEAHIAAGRGLYRERRGRDTGCSETTRRPPDVDKAGRWLLPVDRHARTPLWRVCGGQGRTGGGRGSVTRLALLSELRWRLRTSIRLSYSNATPGHPRRPAFEASPAAPSRPSPARGHSFSPTSTPRTCTVAPAYTSSS